MIDVFKFLLGSIFFFFIPGWMMSRLFRLELKPLENLVISFSLGLATSSLLYFFFGLLHIKFVFIFYLGITLLFFIYKKPWEGMSFKSFKPLSKFLTQQNILLILLIISGLMIIELVYFNYYKTLPDGSLALKLDMDFIYHISNGTYLSKDFSLENPFFSGINTDYHQGMDLGPAMFVDLLGMDILKLLCIYFPTIFFIFLILSIYASMRILIGISASLLFGAFLFADNLSFIVAFLLGIPADKLPWTILLNSTPIYFLFSFNPLLPALIIFFSLLICLNYYLTRYSWNWAAAAAFFIVILFKYKVFLGGQILAALISTGLLFSLKRKHAITKVALLSLILATAFILPTLLRHAGSGFFLTSLKWVEQTKTYLLFNMEYLNVLSGDFKIIIILLLLSIHLLLQLGVRIVAIPAIIRHSFQSENPVMMVLGQFVVIGAVLNTFLASNDPAINYNIVWFGVQSIIIAGIFAAKNISSFLESKKMPLKIFTMVIVLVFAFPSTIQFLYLQNTNKKLTDKYMQIDTNDMEIIQSMNISQPQRVLYNPENLKSAIIVGLSGNLSILHTNYILPTFAFSATNEKIIERYIDIAKFFTSDSTEVATKILKKYNVDLVLSSKSELPLFNYNGILYKMFENQTFVLYKVS